VARPDDVLDGAATRVPDVPRVSLPVADDEPWYRDGLRFRCTTCGNCCTGPAGYVWVQDDEVAQMAATKQMDEASFHKQFVRKLGKRLSLKEVRQPNGEYDCVFLKPLPGDKPGQRKRGCSIYESRPLQCRTWPFWGGVLQSEEAWNNTKRTCPGLDSPKGKLYGVKQIESLRDAQEWPDEAPSST
jgi:Fe-S-cluster containining protein